MQIRSMVYTIRIVTDTGTIVKAGTNPDKLEDDLWSLYEHGVLEFSPSEEEEDEEGEVETALDDEFDAIEGGEPPIKQPGHED